MLETELIRKCQAGQRAAQREIYERFAERMFRICLRYLRQEMEAEDVMAEGFIKIFAKMNQFEYRGDGSLKAWMSRIMVNESLMAIRKKKPLQIVDEEQAMQIDAGTHTDSDLQAEDLYQLVRELPEGYRTVFNLFAIEGFSHKEIADKLNISENTSKSQLRKARAALQEKLKNYGFHHGR